MLGERQKAAATELAQWWDGLRQGGIGSHAVLLAGPAGWGRSTVLDQLPEMIRADAPIGLEVRINGRSLPDGPGLQAPVLRDSLLGPEVRRQAAALLCRSRLRGAPRLGPRSLLLTGMAGTISLLRAGLRRPPQAAWPTTARPARTAPPPARPGSWRQFRRRHRPWWSLTTLITWNQAWPSP